MSTPIGSIPSTPSPPSILDEKTLPSLYYRRVE